MLVGPAGHPKLLGPWWVQASVQPEGDRCIFTAVVTCRQRRYVETLGGRRRPLPGIAGKGQEKAQAERQAINTICQASSLVTCPHA